MQFKTNLTKSEILNQLHNMTTKGSVNLAVGPWYFLHYLLKGRNKKTFFGNVHSNGFNITILRGLFANSISLVGRIEEETNYSIVRLKYDFLVFPFLSMIVFFVALIGMSVFLFMELDRLIPAAILISFGVLVLILSIIQNRNQRRKLIEVFQSKISIESI